MKLINKTSFVALMALMIYSISSCDKTVPYDIVVAPAQVHFLGERIQTYPVRTNPVPVYEIKIGTTDVASVDRTVTYKVTSSTGAVAGTHYTLSPGNTVVIPAGQAVGVIPVQGILSGYPVGRIDTLIFTLQEPSIKAAGFSDTVKLAIGDICSESTSFVLNSFLGTYANTNEIFGTSTYGPYTTTISSVTSTGPTTATIVVTNIWDNGWGPISFTLNWTNPLAKTVTVIPQAAIPGSNAGDLNPIYTGQTVAVRPFATGNVGTFSSCAGTFSLKMQLGVTGLGYFSPVYTVNLAR